MFARLLYYIFTILPFIIKKKTLWGGILKPCKYFIFIKLPIYSLIYVSGLMVSYFIQWFINALLPLFTLMLKFSTIWSVGVPSSWLLSFWQILIILQGCTFWHKVTCLRFILDFPQPIPGISRKHPGFFYGKWYLETRIWALGMLIAIGELLLPDPKRGFFKDKRN